MAVPHQAQSKTLTSRLANEQSLGAWKAGTYDEIERFKVDIEDCLVLRVLQVLLGTFSTAS